MAGVYTVAQVTAYIKNMFEQDFALNRVSVKGEVSNCKYHSSGHLYFTLKDAKSSLSCVMFASSRAGLSGRLTDGSQIVAKGRISVYERDGSYQLYVSQITQEGIGELYRIFEERKKELAELGMFAPEYKKLIPAYSRRIGIVTASTGAAIQDIMQIAYRRNPYVELYLYPALVQGSQAAASIATGISYLDELGLDCLIVGRGGGSIEDLWAFNEQIVAEAIFNCDTPVISAVGHEVDFTIADFVADLRAPTPSAAAELAVFDYRQFAAALEMLKKQLTDAVTHQLQTREQRLERLRLQLQLKHPGTRLAGESQYLDQLQSRMQEEIQRQLTKTTHRLELLEQRMLAQSPAAPLEKGYVWLQTKEGKPVSSVWDVTAGQLLAIQIKDGKIWTNVQRTEPDSQLKKGS